MGTRARSASKVPASKAMPSTTGAQPQGRHSFAASTLPRGNASGMRKPQDDTEDQYGPKKTADSRVGKPGPTVMIKPSRVGTFTAKAKAAGMAPLAYANHVLQNKGSYPADTVQQANFARNFGGASKQRAKGGAK